MQNADDVRPLTLLSPEVHIQAHIQGGREINPEQQERLPHYNYSDGIVCSSIVTRANLAFICRAIQLTRVFRRVGGPISA